MSTMKVGIALKGRAGHVTDQFVRVNELRMFDVIFESELVTILEAKKLET